MNQAPWQTAYPMSPQTAAPTPPTPMDSGIVGKATWARWAFALAALLVTLVAIVLAALAPFGGHSAASPAAFGWNKLYDADLRAGDTRWDLSDGCRYTALGLQSGNNDAQSQCLFTPSTSTVNTAKGFQLRVTLAPAARVNGNAVASIYADDQLLVSIDQTGQYLICQDDCTEATVPNLTGTTIAWHGDNYLQNTLGVRLTNSGQTLAVFVNGQQIATTRVRLNAKSAISIGTSQSSEEIYTHATLYGVGSA